MKMSQSGVLFCLCWSLNLYRFPDVHTHTHTLVLCTTPVIFPLSAPVINAAYSSHGAASLMLRQFPWQPLVAASLLPHGVGGWVRRLSAGLGLLSSLGLHGDLTQQQ